MTQERARLLGLADRVEAATAEQQREMLVEAAEAVCRATLSPDAPSPAWLERWDDLIDAGGWLDLAMTLVPEGFVKNLGDDTGAAWAHVWKDAPAYDGMPFGARAVTLPLALTAACLRTLANQDDSK